MFYNWRKIKLVMSELWDPEDLTKHMGLNRLISSYDVLCTDRRIYDAFENMCQAQGECMFQRWAAIWHEACKIYAHGQNHGLELQIEEILKGKRETLE